MIEISDLGKTYERRGKRVEAVRSVSFRVPDGSIFGLIGPNGAGKTTTLRIIATLLRPDTGSATVNGCDTVRQARDVRNQIGFLTGDMKLSGSLSPRELLYFFGELNHLERAKVTERIGWLSGYLQMADFLDRPAAKLSTGMKQKAAIAVSIVHDPSVVVFDEPTSGLDILAAKIVVDFLKDCRSRGKTVILSTHVISEAERLCDTLGILVRGRLLAQGSRDEILREHGKPGIEEVFFSIYHDDPGETR